MACGGGHNSWTTVFPQNFYDNQENGRHRVPERAAVPEQHCQIPQQGSRAGSSWFVFPWSGKVYETRSGGSSGTSVVGSWVIPPS